MERLRIKLGPKTSTRGCIMVRTLRLALLIGVVAPTALLAWLYPEHREITLVALSMLNPEPRSVLDKLWSEARVGHETRLCSQMADTSQGLKPQCIDYAAWPSIGGDHSCSAAEMLHEVLDDQWILKVAAVGATLNTRLARATNRSQRMNALRRSDIDFLRADPDYATRALTNNAHFLLARPNAAIETAAYVAITLGQGAELNAVGTYVLYHVRALAAAGNVTRDHLRADVRARVALAAFADEAFALHFLEDGFASGHVTGNWGKTAIRKGTHDYYNEHGVEMRTWNGGDFVGFGDAYLGPEDAKRVATAVRDSLTQLADAFSGKLRVVAPDNSAGLEPEAFDVCQETHFSSAVLDRDDAQTLVPVIAQTPIPFLGDVPGQLPRFRSELGPFVGVSAAALGEALNGGLGSIQEGASGIGGLQTGIRIGVGLEGVLDESGDGLVFADFGYRQDAASRGTASIPGQGAFTLRLRAPFWLIPGDIIAAAPVLAFVSRRTLERMAVRAGNGGLIPWQSVIPTPIGRFQFVLGREVNVSWYPLNTHNPTLLPTPGVAPVGQTVVAIKSLQVDFPIVEYRPFRAFSRNQTSSLTFQIYSGFDTPTESEVLSPAGAPSPQLRTIGLVGLRVAFEWRYYVK